MSSDPAVSSASGYSPPGRAGAEDALATDLEYPKNDCNSDEEDLEEDDGVAIKPWDEGGPSDCGYGDTVHSTLMSVGATVQKVVGPPGKEISHVQQSIGNWFQELSYAARDIMRGENTADMHQDAADAVKTLMSGGKTKNDNQEDDANETSDQSKENQVTSTTGVADF